MIPAPQNNKPQSVCDDLDRFQPAQVEQMLDLTEQMRSRFDQLDAEQCQIFKTIWSLIAQATAPVAITATSRQGEASVKRNLDALSAAQLIWYDSDLHSILQCPPFSALTTSHRVKAFGWDKAQVCSLVDAPLALLLYGPNTWMEVRSQCQYSGEDLEFQITMDDEHRLRTHSLLDTQQWRIWIPSGLTNRSAVAYGPHAASSFYSEADYEAYRDRHPDEPGALYTFDEAISFSECLLKLYHDALYT